MKVTGSVFSTNSSSGKLLAANADTCIVSVHS